MTFSPMERSTRLEETKRIARVLRIVQLISSQPRAWTRRRLAVEFELSERMIDRDLELVRHGLCFEVRRGHGGYYLVGGPVVKPLQVSIPEALALALAAQQARDTGTVDAGTLASALAQLESALPPGVIPYLRRASDIGSQAAFGPVRERGPMLAILEQAMAERRKARISYATASRGGAVSEREIAPYYLQPYERSWLVIAHDSRRDEVLMFKVDRIQHCELLPERFTVPADFDVASYLGTGWGVLRGEAGPAEDVELRFTAKGAAWVRDERWHHSQEMEDLPDGGLVMRFHCGVTHELVRWVLWYGAEVFIQGPSHLRKAVLEEARRVVGGSEDQPA